MVRNPMKTLQSRLRRGARRNQAPAQGSDALRTSLLVGMTLGDDGSAKAGAKVLREFVELRVAINLDGLLGRIADHVAVMAPRQMIFQFSFCARINHAIKIVRQLTQEISALHWLVSPVSGFSLLLSGFSLPFSRRWKKRLRRSRNCK